MRISLAHLLVPAALVLAACSDEAVAPIYEPDGAPLFARAGASQDYVILGVGETLPADLDSEVSAAGGSLVVAYPEFGVAVARSGQSSFASRLARANGIEAVAPDVWMTWTPLDAESRELVDETAFATDAVASIGDNETFYSFQWAPAAIQAPEAWNAGWTGRGVRVAILDGGIYDLHRDLQPNLDVAASRSFVPNQVWNTDVGTFWHGTHVAGIVAAADNGIGTIGIAPNATLIGVKVLHSGGGFFSYFINGIYYAATPVEAGGAGADIINMSLSGMFDEKAKSSKAGIRELMKAVDRATRYAWKQGVTVIAAAANDAIDLDHFRTLVVSPAMNQHVIGVSATGPHGWALGSTEFSRPAYYTNYGKAIVDLSAPGGTFGLFVVDGVNQLCTKVGTFVTLMRFCETFDGVMSTVRGGATSTASYNWAQGTSMAAPTVAGVAALIIERHGGSLHPADVAAALRQGATDLGKPGNDAFHGHGFVNAFRSVQ